MARRNFYCGGFFAYPFISDRVTLPSFNPCYALSQISAAIKSDNYEKFHYYVPRFSNGQDLKQAVFEAFIAAVNSEKFNVAKTLSDTANFSRNSRSLDVVKFYPKARYINVTSTADNASIDLSLKRVPIG